MSRGLGKQRLAPSRHGLVLLATLLAACEPGPLEASLQAGPGHTQGAPLLYFEGGFESGQPTFDAATSSWTVQREGPWPGATLAPSAYAFRVDTAHRREGRQSGRFEVRDKVGASTTPRMWPGGQESSSGERSEVRRDAISGTEFEGDEYIYAWSTRFDSGWSPVVGWALIVQWHDVGHGWSPPVELAVTPDDKLRVTHASGNPDAGTEVRTHVPFLDTLNKGQWNDFIMRVRWHRSAGAIEIWHRKEGETGFTRRVALDNIGTLHELNGSAVPVYLRHGLYRDANHTQTHVLHHDGMRMGASYEDVVIGFPARFGHTTAGPDWTRTTPDKKRASAFFLAESGTINRLVAFLDGNGGGTGAQKLQGVIYADANGAPGALLGTTAELSIPAGAPGAWRVLALPAPLQLRRGTYWLGLLSGEAYGVARFAHDTVTDALRFNDDVYADGPAMSFGTAQSDAKRMSIYVTYQ